ncbi:Membrane protein involved in the export of O-antigen and teichoic acid [Spirosomataceae bacterium TFI 002]|nr:Membrane protein involved in the export of O-antigen and teichoic acid [Spirosomataceae bacterium TFI 002]
MSVIKRQTIIGTIWSYAGVAIGTITQAFLIPNFFTEEQNGLLQMLFSWMLILVLFADLGFGNAGTKFFPKFRSKEKKHNGFIFYGFIAASIGISISFFFLHFLKTPITSTLNTTDNGLFEKYYYFLFPIILATTLFNLLFNYARGLYDTIVGNFLSQFAQRILILAAVIAYISDLVDFDQFMVLWTISIFSQFPLMLWHCYRLGDFSFSPVTTIFTKGFRLEFVKYAIFSILTGLSSIVITRLDTLMVYEYLGLANTGIYSTCLLFGSVMMMSYQVSLKASTAIVVDALEQKDYPKIDQIFKKSGLTQLIFGTALFITVVCNVDLLFSFIKPSYSAGKWVLIIVGFAKLIDLSFGINSLILVFSKHYKKDSLLIISFVSVLFLLNHLLIPRYGLNGAAIAALIATILFNLSRNFIIYKYFKIHAFSKPQLTVILIGIVVFAIGLILPGLGDTIFQRLLALTYKSTLVLGLFGVLIRVTNVSPDISRLIDQMLTNIGIKFS